jgi:hypothetical protein
MLNSENWEQECEELLKTRKLRGATMQVGDKPFAKLSDVQELAQLMLANAQIRQSFIESDRLIKEGVAEDDERVRIPNSRIGRFKLWYHLKRDLETSRFYTSAAGYLVVWALREGLNLQDREAVVDRLQRPDFVLKDFIDFSV